MGGNANTDLFIYAHVADLSGAAPHVLPFCILARPCSLSDQKYGFYSSTGIPVPLPILKDRGRPDPLNEPRVIRRIEGWRPRRPPSGSREGRDGNRATRQGLQSDLSVEVALCVQLANT